jgi:hypothetical protein
MGNKDSAPARASTYRELATVLRALAPTLKTQAEQEELLTLASGYERLAEYAKSQVSGTMSQELERGEPEPHC